MEFVVNVLKYRYLSPKNILEGDALHTAEESAIVEYNDRRPRGSLDGVTSREAYYGIDKETMGNSENLRTAQKARI